MDPDRSLTNLFKKEEITKTIMTLKNNKASGPDGLYNEHLKASTNVLLQIFTDLMNFCIQIGTVQTSWRNSIIKITYKETVTTIGDHLLESMDTADKAEMFFKCIYKKKSGNFWEERGNFKKVPGCFFPVDLDYICVWVFLVPRIIIKRSKSYP